MAANLEKTILEKLQALPDRGQQEVLALIETLLDREQYTQPESTFRPISEIFGDLSSQIPLEEWAELPQDGAEQHDHYLYGLPKRNNS